MTQIKLFSVVFLALLSASQAALAQDPICPVEQILNVSNPPVDYRAVSYTSRYDIRLPVMAPFWDTNADGFKEFFSVEGYKVVLRSGKDGEQIAENQYPQNSVVTSIGRLGADITGDGSQDYYIGYAFPGSAQPYYGLNIYNGATYTIAYRFPEMIIDVTEKAEQCDRHIDLYPFAPNSRGFSAVVLENNKIFIGVPSSNLAIIVDPVDIILWAHEWRKDCGLGGCHIHCPSRDPYQIIRPSAATATIDSYGASVVAIRTGSKIDKIIVNAPTSTYRGAGYAGIIFFYTRDNVKSTKYNEVLNQSYMSRGMPNNFFGATLMNLDDMNKDGHEDFALSSPGNVDNDFWGGTLFLSYGPNFSMDRRLFGRKNTFNAEFAYSFGGGEDMNEDGKEDIVVSGPGNGGRGVVRVMDPVAGTEKLSIHGYEADQRFGQSVVVTAPGHVVVGDATGKRYFLLLGEDKLPAKKPDGKPDYCAEASGGNLTTNVQALSDRISPLVKQAQSTMHMLSITNKPWDKSGMAQLKGLRKKLTSVSNIIRNNQPAILSIGAKLNTSFANTLKLQIDAYFNIVTQSEKDKNKRSYIKPRWRVLSRSVTVLMGYFGTTAES